MWVVIINDFVLSRYLSSTVETLSYVMFCNEEKKCRKKKMNSFLQITCISDRPINLQFFIDQSKEMIMLQPANPKVFIFFLYKRLVSYYSVTHVTSASSFSSMAATSRLCFCCSSCVSCLWNYLVARAKRQRAVRYRQFWQCVEYLISSFRLIFIVML